MSRKLSYFIIKMEICEHILMLRGRGHSSKKKFKL